VSETRHYEAALLHQENPPKCTFWSHKLLRAAEGYFCVGNSNLGGCFAVPDDHSIDAMTLY